MRYQVPALAACPPGYFNPRGMGGYDAYGAPVVLHDITDEGGNMAGGIFKGSLGSLGMTDAEVQSWVSQAGSAAERLARQLWAMANPGKTPPAGNAPPQQQQQAQQQMKEEEKILGLPPAVAIGGAAVAALFLLKMKR